MAELLGVDAENLTLDVRLTEDEANRLTLLASVEAARWLGDARERSAEVLDGDLALSSLDRSIELGTMLKDVADLLFEAMSELPPEGSEVLGTEPPGPRGPHFDHLGERDWQVIATLCINSGTMGFGDGRAVELVKGGGSFEWSRVHGELGSVGPFPVAAVGTGGDLDLPIELLRDDAGEVVAARLELVDDVAHLAGEWAPLNRLELPTGDLAICDPCCSPERYWPAIDVRPGTWNFEVFDMPGGGILGARVVHESLAPPPPRDAAG